MLSLAGKNECECSVGFAGGCALWFYLRVSARSLDEYLPVIAALEITKWQGDVTRMHKQASSRISYRMNRYA